ncbi:MAG: DnaJ domain-containing protein [Fimbriimonadales bacterium]
MAKTHYEVLGVSATCSQTDIRSAYRKLVLVHHPDRSTNPKSKSIFLSATEAYEVLGDKDRRREYDSRLTLDAQLRQQAERRAASGPQSASARIAEVKLDVNRLNTLYSRGNFPEAEKLARTIIQRDRRQPVAYAVLGNLARMSGDRKEAIKMYSFALQFDPRNPVYQRRYEELVEGRAAVAKTPTRSTVRKAESKQNQMFGPMFGLGLILLACVYIVFAHEQAVMPWIKYISTWTVGLIGMSFLSGVVLGSCMALDGLLENYSSMGTSGLGRISPTVALATIAVVSFWAAVVMYVVIGLRWRAFNNSTSRLIASVVAGTCLLAFASEASGTISGLQVFLWGGNLVYIGALCGWMVTDALRGANR